MEWLQVLTIIVAIGILVIGLNRNLSDRMTRMETRLLGAIRDLAGRIDRVDEWRVQQGERLTRVEVRIEASNHASPRARVEPEE